MALLQTEAQSRYKDTALLTTARGTPFLDLWTRPGEIDAMRVDARSHRVKENEIGRLDLLAYRYYGDVKLWWVIAAVNNMIDSIDEMYAGQVIAIPDINRVRRFTWRS